MRSELSSQGNGSRIQGTGTDSEFDSRNPAPLDRPGLPFPAFKIGSFPSESFTRRHLIPLGVQSGLPAVSVQSGFTENVTMGIQLVGAPYDEAGILRLGYAYEQATPWHERHPTMS